MELKVLKYIQENINQVRGIFVSEMKIKGLTEEEISNCVEYLGDREFLIIDNEATSHACKYRNYHVSRLSYAGYVELKNHLFWNVVKSKIFASIPYIVIIAISLISEFLKYWFIPD